MVNKQNEIKKKNNNCENSINIIENDNFNGNTHNNFLSKKRTNLDI